jgi:hypothetical protein
MRIQALRNFIHLWGFNRRIILSTVFGTIEARNVERVECRLTHGADSQKCHALCIRKGCPTFACSSCSMLGVAETSLRNRAPEFLLGNPKRKQRLHK